MTSKRRIPYYITASNREPERLGSPALYAQRRLMSATGWAESERKSKPKKKNAGRKRVAGK